MNAETGGRKTDVPPTRDWILGCEGFRVEGPDGLLGHVIGPVYDFSARWDCPRALAVKGAHQVVEVEVAQIEAVDAAGGRIRVRSSR